MNGTRHIRSEYDAVVVGARVAGAATAMLLARAGKRVLAVESSAEGSDTLSTHALMRAGVMQLKRWAVLAGTDKALADYQVERDAFAVEFLDLSDQIASFDWDLDHLKALHLRLSKLMNRECDLIRSFDTARLEYAGVAGITR